MGPPRRGRAHGPDRAARPRRFSGTTTGEIAARVGITEAALYRHFAGKEALYAAIIDRKMAAPALADRLVEAASSGDDRGVFGGLARIIVEALQADPAFLRILLYTALEGHSLAEPFFRQRMAALREFLSGYIARRTREGVFRDVDPVLAARAFVGMVWDYVLVRELFGQKSAYPVPGDAAAETFVSIFLDGVRAGKE